MEEMPDLLAHALIAYTICTGISIRYGWITPAYVTTGMVGAFIPDIAKVDLVVPDEAIEALLGMPFSWLGIHTFGGVLLGVAIGATFAADHERIRIAALLSIGAASHLLADAFLLRPTGRSYAFLWPLTPWHPPSPGLYLSSDPAPAIVAGVLAIGMRYVKQELSHNDG